MAMDHSDFSSPLILDFEKRCHDAGLKPAAVLKAAGVHPTLWWKWRAGAVSPTLRNFEAAWAELDKISDAAA